MFSKLSALAVAGLLAAVPVSASSCKCIPGQSCWPTTSQWTAFNSSIEGNLIKNVPVAAPCYPGASFDATQCAAVVASWALSSFQTLFPIGYSYPHTQSCDIPGGNTTSCSLGDSPVYSVNGVSTSVIQKGLAFAKQHNLRVAVKMTGHDLLARSTGFGSLEIWIANLQNGITYSEAYKPVKSCSAANYKGPAITVAGGYHWQQVYDVAQANNAVVAGGGCPDVGAIGGYLQGGGHSLAMHNYGLAADQVLQASVMLADGSIVEVSPCCNSDLFTAIRGGGGGTYGLVISATMKAHPMSSVVGQELAIFPMSEQFIPDFMKAVQIIYEDLPDLLDGGLNGYGSWSAYSPTPFVPGSNSTSGLVLSLGGFNQTTAQAQKTFAPTLAKLMALKTVVTSVTYTQYKDYWSYYYTTNGINSAAESESALLSRMLPKSSLQNPQALAQMLNSTAGTPEQFTFNEIGAIGGGAVLTKPDAWSGVNPAWRSTYVLHYVARGWAPTSDYAIVQEAHHDVTYVKGGELNRFAPNMGTYMNEADWQDPNYLNNYYGSALSQHQQAKAKYDPEGFWYCPTCVGSNQWEQASNGAICKIGY